MSYGKHFASMYTGSMVGSGALVFAVWGYVIANMKPTNLRDVTSEMVVEVNPMLLGPTLGESPKDVDGVLKRLCSPDPKSRTQVLQGRRLEDLGAFLYRVVNGRFYWKIKNEEERKIQLQQSQQRQRDKKAGKLPVKPVHIHPFVDQIAPEPPKEQSSGPEGLV